MMVLPVYMMAVIKNEAWYWVLGFFGWEIMDR